MLSNYKRQRAEAILRSLDKDVMINLQADFVCSVNLVKEKSREAHLDRLMGKLDVLRAMKVISFNQQMLLIEFYLETRREQMDAA